MAQLPRIIVQSDAPPPPKGSTIKHGKKPPECMVCAFNQTGYGYAKDWVGATPKAAFMFPSPSKDDVVEGVALGSDWGGYILAQYIYPAGFVKDDVILTNVIRCYPPFNVRYHRPGYPTGVVKTKCEATCRSYDVLSLAKFDPNLFMVTFDPHDAMNTPAYRRQIQADLKKLPALVADGLRPLVLFGSEPGEIFMPHIKGNGGSKTWRGHFQLMEFKFKGSI